MQWVERVLVFDGKIRIARGRCVRIAMRLRLQRKAFQQGSGGQAAGGRAVKFYSAG
jgi:hypothetical protein